MQEDKLIVFSLALGAIGIYGTFLPHVSQVAIDYQTPEEKRVLREAELIGAAHLLTLGIITSYLAHSALPFFLSFFLSATMFATYEYALARVAVGGR